LYRSNAASLKVKNLGPSVLFSISNPEIHNMKFARAWVNAAGGARTSAPSAGTSLAVPPKSHGDWLDLEFDAEGRSTTS
jgi:hypothetical protein